MNMNDAIKQLSLFANGRTIFGQEPCRYVVPIYQRAFAWGTGETVDKNNEIVQLVEDIWDSRSKEGCYYLGTLVVNRRNKDAEGEDVYEVIDGQQRLTALFIIFACLGRLEDSGKLKYESRPWADTTLENIDKFVKGEKTLDDVELEGGIVDGVGTVKDALRSKNTEEFIRALEKTVLFRVEVPPNTDLNHYFEIMNTRGEQLEPQDIVKAQLLEAIGDPGRRDFFAKVWNACSDMNGYVQMKFDVATRDTLFKEQWNALPVHLENPSAAETRHSFKTLCDAVLEIHESDDDDEEDDREVVGKDGYRPRFSAIIDFPHFLMHVLKVYLVPDAETDVGDLDDKVLIDMFKEAMKAGTVNGHPVTNEQFAWGYLECLLTCRCLFDRYVIKREREGDADAGTWSLQELQMSKSGQGNRSRSATYVQTKDEGGMPNDVMNERARMIQSCLRVSYTSPKSMHWITASLRWLYSHKTNVSLEQLCEVGKKFAKQGVRCEFWANEHFDSLGVHTPHIALNFLDYVLWEKMRRGDADVQVVCRTRSMPQLEPFAFEFRNTVEHWYPQHPSDFDAWDKVDMFGNLAILPRSENSRFSNLKPNAKKEQFGEKIAHGSLKLRLMANLTPKGEAGERQWREKTCREHGEEMLRILESVVARKDEIIVS